MKPEGERKPVKKWETLNHIMAMANHTRTVLENRKIFDCSYRPRRGASQDDTGKAESMLPIMGGAR